MPQHQGDDPGRPGRLRSGTLGILIPPLVMAIVYAVVAQQSLGEILVDAVFPGLLLSEFYVA